MSLPIPVPPPNPAAIFNGANFVGQNYATYEYVDDTFMPYSGGSFVGPVDMQGNALSDALLLGVRGTSGSTGASRLIGSTSGGHPTSGSWTKGDFVVDNTGSFWVCTVTGTPGTWVQVYSGGGGAFLPLAGGTMTGAINMGANPITNASSVQSSGLTGATAGATFAGATTSGAPLSGTHAVGEFVVDRTGSFWVCTGAGTPGTWVQVVAAAGAYLPLAGGTMTGPINMNNQNLNNAGVVESGTFLIGNLNSGSSTYPYYSAVAYSHDNVQFLFDGWFNGLNPASSSPNGTFRLAKGTDWLYFQGGKASAGSNVSMSNFLSISDTGIVQAGNNVLNDGSGNSTFTGSITANGGSGTAGQLLTSNGSSPAYWSSPAFLPLSGGTLTGPLGVGAAPSTEFSVGAASSTFDLSTTYKSTAAFSMNGSDVNLVVGGDANNESVLQTLGNGNASTIGHTGYALWLNPLGGNVYFGPSLAGRGAALSYTSSPQNSFKIQSISVSGPVAGLYTYSATYLEGFQAFSVSQSVIIIDSGISAFNGTVQTVTAVGTVTGGVAYSASWQSASSYAAQASPGGYITFRGSVSTWCNILDDGLGDMSIAGSITANGSPGAAGQVLTSNGTSPAYWSSLAFLPLAGGTMTGALNMGANAISNVASLALNYLSSNTTSIFGAMGSSIYYRINPDHLLSSCLDITTNLSTTTSTASADNTSLPSWQMQMGADLSDYVKFARLGARTTGTFSTLPLLVLNSNGVQSMSATNPSANVFVFTPTSSSPTGWSVGDLVGVWNSSVPQYNGDFTVTAVQSSSPYAVTVTSSESGLASSALCSVERIGDCQIGTSGSGTVEVLNNFKVDGSLSAAGSTGSAGQVLTSNGTSPAYWSNASGWSGTVSSYTPTLAFGGSSTGMTYSTQSGYYSQVGNIVFCTFKIVLTSKGSSTGLATISLPVACGNNASSYAPISMGEGVTLDAGYPSLLGYIQLSHAYMQLLETGSGQTATQIADTYFANNSILDATFMYFTN